MNKLTEIKRSYEQVKRNAHKYPQMGDRYYQIRMDDLGYLISLLEEKDKALAVIADENNWRSYDGYPLWNNDTEYLDPAEIARKALNTSSNNEGETQP